MCVWVCGGLWFVFGVCFGADHFGPGCVLASCDVIKGLHASYRGLGHMINTCNKEPSGMVF